MQEDYADFLRQHKYEVWGKDDVRTAKVRAFSVTHTDPREYVDKCQILSDATVANIMLTLIHQIDAMLAKVMKAMEEQFIKEGGIKEAMSRTRRQHRGY